MRTKDDRPRLAPRLDRIPVPLKELPRWVVWRALKTEHGKYRKVPINARTGGNARSNDPSTWTSFEEAAKYWESNKKHLAGMGIMLGDLGDGLWLVGADFDNCVTDGRIDNDVLEYIAALPGYAEFSPSGSGVKVFFITSANLSRYTCNVKSDDGRGREFYCASPRYFTTTGHRVRMGQMAVVDEHWRNMHGQDIELALVTIFGPDTKVRSVTRPLPSTLSVMHGNPEDANPEFLNEHGVDEFARFAERPAGWPLERVARELLEDISADCSYDQWFRVCCALHHHGEGSDEWFELFNSWSQTAPDRYPGEDQARAKWDSVHPESFKRPLVTLRTLIKMADEARVRRAGEAKVTIAAASTDVELREIAKALAAKRLNEIELEDLAHALKRRAKELGTVWRIATTREMLRAPAPSGNAQTLPWASELVYVKDERKWYDAAGSAYSVESLNAAFAGMTPRFPPPSGALMDPYYYITKEVPDAVLRVVGKRFRPDIADRIFEEHGQQYLNIYPSTLAALPQVPATCSAGDLAAIQTVKDHIRWLLDDEREAALLWDALCWIVQNPGTPLRWMPLIIGQPGCGKSFFEVLLRAVMGHHENVRGVSPDVFASQFNDFASRAMVVVLSETYFPEHMDRVRLMEKLKPLITDEHVEIHPKGKPAYQTRNCTAYIGLSNHKDAMPGAAATRRVAVFSSSRTSEEIKAHSEGGYYHRLFGAAHSHTGALRRVMLEHDAWHADFTAGDRAPDTTALKTMTYLTDDPLVEEVEALLWNGGTGFKLDEDGCGALITGDLLRALQVTLGRGAPRQSHLRRILDGLGFIPLPGSGLVRLAGGRVVRPKVTGKLIEKAGGEPSAVYDLVRKMLRENPEGI